MSGKNNNNWGNYSSDDIQSWDDFFPGNKLSGNISKDSFPGEHAQVKIELLKDQSRNALRIALGIKYAPILHKWFLKEYQRLSETKKAIALILKEHGESEIVTERCTYSYHIDTELQKLVNLNEDCKELTQFLREKVHNYRKHQEELLMKLRENKSIEMQGRYLQELMESGDPELLVTAYGMISHYHLKKQLLSFLKEKLQFAGIAHMLVSRMVREEDLVLQLISFLRDHEDSPYYEKSLGEIPPSLAEVVHSLWK